MRRTAVTSITGLLLASSILLAQQVAIQEYALPAGNAKPNGITAGPDGALWFTEFGLNAHKIGRITPAGVISEFPVPNSDSRSQAITTGPDGALWFTEYAANKIGRIMTTGAFNEYSIPTAFAEPEGIAAGPDGALWFTEWNANRIGRITTTGVVTEYSLPTPGANPRAITAGPDSAMWFTETTGEKIGRITTFGAITEFSIPPVSCCPRLHAGVNSIAAGSDGALWFTGSTGNTVGRITTAGVVTEYFVPTTSASLNGIVAGPDGALWFTEFATNRIGRISTSGSVTDYGLPTANSNPVEITVGPDGQLWFTAVGSNQIGQAVLATAMLSVSPSSGSFQTDLTFTGTAFGPNESVQIYRAGIGSRVLARVTTDDTGSFTVSALEPQSPFGPRLFLGLGQTSGKIGAINFSVIPTLMLIPSSGPAGSNAQVAGYGFGPLEGVEIYWSNPEMLLGFATANLNGTFSNSTALNFTVPDGSPPGQNTVLAIGQITGARANGVFTVQ